MPTPMILPEPIAEYFVADRHDAEALVRCFTPDATVKDEGRTHAGRDAIKAWKAAASHAFEYSVGPVAIEEDESTDVVVVGRVTGNFPGSPVDLRYRFRLERALIASLEITA
jgi:ketosteroid isomerase-like protein